MIFIDEIKPMFLYKRPFHLPIDEKDKRKHSAVFLLTPNFLSSVNVLKNPLIINKNYFESYFIEKNITYYINQEGYIIGSADEIINEAETPAKFTNPKSLSRSLKLRMNKAKYKLNKSTDFERNNVGTVQDPENAQKKEIEDIKQEETLFVNKISDDYELNENYLRCRVDNNDIMFIFNEYVNADEEIFNEAVSHNAMLHKLLYKERFRTPKEVLNIYKQVKNEIPWMKRTFLEYPKYKERNLFIDLSFYNETFFNNNIYRMDKGVELYFEFIDRFIQDKRLTSAGYTKKTIFVPILDWLNENEKIDDYKYTDGIGLLSMIMRLVKTKSDLLERWKDLDFVFMTDYGYFKADISKLEITDIPKFKLLVEKLKNKEPIEEPDVNKESKKAIVANIVDGLETNQKIKLNNLTGDSGEVTKDELIDKIEKAASVSNTTDEAIDNLEDDFIKNIIDTLANEEEGEVQISATRRARLDNVEQDFLNKKLKNTTVREMISNSKKDVELPVTKLELDTVNEGWDKLSYSNFEKAYDVNEDIVAILHSFKDKSEPVVVRNIDVQNTSTSEDYIETYSVDCEDAHGQRFKLVFDIPKLKDDVFMFLRGNEKTISGQLVLLPISKTDHDTVQIVSNYKKIFIRRYGANGKSFIITDRLIKTLNKNEIKGIKITPGENSRICSKYDLPIDYIDLASIYSRIETKNYIIYFNLDEITSKYEVDKKVNGIPIAYNKDSKSLVYFKYDYENVSSMVYSLLAVEVPEFKELYEQSKPSKKYVYSKASILSSQIPIIVMAAYSEGLLSVMKKADIKFDIVEKKPRDLNYDYKDVIKFNDAFIIYDVTQSSSLLMNGLKECDTENYSIKDINSKSMYLDFLDLFGGRLLSDGLDNFYDCMIDSPITTSVLERYKLPTDYIELLLYANELLADNKYIKHTSMYSNRYRSNELIAGYTYQAIAESYGRYKTSLKRNRTAPMTIKRTEIIDKLLLDPTCSDASKLNDISEAENANAVSFKGLAGMNSDRSYSLDKRTFDDSMINILGLSTGFAANVGINRQTTIDMNIEGKRGYLKINPNNTDDMGVTKTLTVTEALTPFGTTSDDPFRSLMTFIQTSKHSMRTQKGMPMLISNGADQALPFMTSNTFSYNAKENGKVAELTDEYMIIQYDSGKAEYINLKNEVLKNSNGGFFISVKLDTDLKIGSKVKANQVVAYDKLSYSDAVGHTGNLAYCQGPLVKIAILNTDEGYEDSAKISEWLSEAMMTEMVVKKDKVLPKNTNIYNMAKVGQPVQEGDPLLIFQNPFDDEDANILLKNLVGDEEDISDLGRIPIKSKITGVVEDIKMYRTCEKEELSDSLRKEINRYEKPIGDLKKIISKYNIDYANRIPADYKLETTGKLKKAEDSVLIEFYLKYQDKMSIGDKLVYYSALKGVVKSIFPKGLEPYTDLRPEESIDSLLAVGSVNGRMVTSILKVGGIHKFLIELDRTVKTMVDIPYKYLTED